MKQKSSVLMMCWQSSTYDFLEDVDFIEKHALLVVVHVALTEHLDGTLSARLSVHTHAHLTESA